jgi:GH25 family lysozyme M1 (1,4-beta-N-acetylmuramidase)
VRGTELRSFGARRHAVAKIVTAVVVLTAVALSAGLTAPSASASPATASKAGLPSTTPLPLVSHPQDDHAGSTIAAHEAAGPPARAGRSLAAATTQTPGLDVSHYQGDIYWPTVYAKGARFAYIKASESTTYVDPKFGQNYAGARAAGLVRGAYHFALPDRSSGTTQADYLLAHGGGLSPDGMTLPPMLDMEYNPYGATCYGLSPNSMALWVRAFSDRIHARTNRYPTIYTTTNWWSTCTGNNAGFGANPLFIARYNSTVGTLPAGWSAYTMWQYASSGTFPGDQDRFNGTLAQMQAFARGSQACSPGIWHGSLTPPGGMSYDFSGDGHPDVVSRSPDGLLHLYHGTGSSLSGSAVIGCGWNGFTAIFSPGDFNGDGQPDIIARTATGDLFVYYWNGQHFSWSTKLGTNWGGFTALFSPGDFTGDGHPDVVGRDAAGDLRLYPGTGGSLGAYRIIGVGWNALTAVFSTGDFNNDHHADIVARTKDGTLRLYTGTGSRLAGSQTIGVGWGGMTGFDGSRDFTGDGRSDLLARTPSGSLQLYRSNAVRLTTPAVIGTGWNGMTALT